MLTPEDSKRVADKLIQTIDRLENRYVLVLNHVDKKVSETNLNSSIANGIETSLQRAFASRYVYGKTWLQEEINSFFNKIKKEV